MDCHWLRKLTVFCFCLAASAFVAISARADIVTGPAIEKSNASNNLELVIGILHHGNVETASTGRETGLAIEENGLPAFDQGTVQSKKVPEPSQLSIPVFLLLIWAFVRLDRKKTASLRM